MPNDLKAFLDRVYAEKAEQRESLKLPLSETEPVPAPMPIARAVSSPPCGQRVGYLLWVTRCPICGTGHVHRTQIDPVTFQGKLMRNCPSTGKRYRVKVRRLRQAVPR